MIKKRRRVTVRKIKEILRLHYESKFSNRSIAKACNVSPSTISDYLEREQSIGVDYKELLLLDDKSIFLKFYPENIKEKSSFKLPDMKYLHQEMRKVTLQLLWEEYKSKDASGYCRSQFFKLYRDFRKTLNPVMRIEHKAGDKMFVDFSGDKLHYVDKDTGKFTFFSMFELNAAVSEELEKLNNRPMQGLSKSRRQFFEEIDKPALKPLRTQIFEIFIWKKAKVHIDYHIEVERSYYSVPYKFLHKEVDIKYNDHTVEIYHEGNRIASHIRTFKQRLFVTDNIHRPHSHREYLDWTPERIRHWGTTIGKHTDDVMNNIMLSKRHVEHGYRACLGILRLSKKYSPERLEKACRKALAIGAVSYKTIRSLLKSNLEGSDVDIEVKPSAPIIHNNIRGSEYYQQEVVSA
jgi:transposase